MAKSKVKIKSNNKLNKKLEKLKDEICKGMVEEMSSQIGYEIFHAYRQTVDAFYAHFTPDWYERTLSTYEAYKKIDSSLGDTGRRKIGIRVSSSYIKGNPYTSDKSKVFKNTFVYGRHGNMSNAVKNKIAERFGWKKRYSIKDYNRSMVPMSKTPKAIMDEWFGAFLGRGEERYVNAKVTGYVNTEVKDKKIKVKAKKDITDEAWARVRKKILG